MYEKTDSSASVPFQSGRGRRRTTPDLPKHAGQPPPQPAPAAPPGDIRLALAQLSPIQRAVLEEICFRGRTAKEASATLDIPVIAVKSALRHALHALRAHLAGAA